MKPEGLTKRQLRRLRERLNSPRPNEIEPGRPVPANWDAALVERWADRKARRAAEKESVANGRA